MGESTPWWCPKKIWNPPKKSSLLSLLTKLSKLKTCRWNFDMFGGLETSNCPQEGLTYPTEAWECTSRTYITRILIGFVCLNGRKFPSTARRFFHLSLFFSSLIHPSQISSIWFRVVFFLSHSVTIKLPCPSNMCKWTPRTAATPRKYMVFGTESRDAQVLPLNVFF